MSSQYLKNTLDLNNYEIIFDVVNQCYIIDVDDFNKLVSDASVAVSRKIGDEHVAKIDRLETRVRELEQRKGD